MCVPTFKGNVRGCVILDAVERRTIVRERKKADVCVRVRLCYRPKKNLVIQVTVAKYSIILLFFYIINLRLFFACYHCLIHPAKHECY